MSGAWGVLVIYADGSQEWMRHGRSGGGAISRHPSKARAEAIANFMRIGMSSNPDVQSVNAAIVPRGER